MRVIISGGKGMLGTAFAGLRKLPEPYTEIIALGRDEMDVSDFDSVQAALRRYNPGLLVHAAAVVDPDIAEAAPDVCRKLNVEASGLIAGACAGYGCKMVFMSTEYVYDGTIVECYPDSGIKENPLNVYGKSKLAGEQLVSANCPQALLVRTGLLYGAKENLVTKTLQAARNGKPLSAVSDQFSSPTNVADLAEAVLTVAARGTRGVINLANSGKASRHEFVSAALEMAGVTAAVRSVQAASLNRAAPRPGNTALCCERYREITGHYMRSWREALAAYIAGLEGPR